MRQRRDIIEAVQLHADTVMRVCSVHLQRQADREDAFQDTFLRYAQSQLEFNDEEHRKAWLIRVSTNLCKDYLRKSESRVCSLDELQVTGSFSEPVSYDGDECGESAQAADLLAALHQIDETYRTALYLKYYEGYTAAQIAKITGKPENTVYSDLVRGRKALKEVLEHGEWS